MQINIDLEYLSQIIFVLHFPFQALLNTHQIPSLQKLVAAVNGVKFIHIQAMFYNR